MHIQKTFTEKPRISDTPGADNRSAKTAAVKVSVQPKPLAASSAHSVSSLIASSGLPSDKLSASILSFARFFSLPIKPQLMADIRRQAFTQTSAAAQTTSQQADTSPSASIKHTAANNAPESNSGSLAAEKNRQALSLAAAAAESKGVELDAKGLESYSKAVDPEWERRQDSGGQKREQRNKDQNEQNKSDAIKTGSVNGACGYSASSLEKAVLESAQENPLLCILNRLPGRNGQRWIVLPFDFCENGQELRVSMRILLEADFPFQSELSNRSVFMALDIAETGNAEKEWLFILESANNQVSRLSVFINDELSSKEKSLLKRELSDLFAIPSERVTVKLRLDSFPFETERCEDLLQSIDEAV